jgi:hypothetical protein
MAYLLYSIVLPLLYSKSGHPYEQMTLCEMISLGTHAVFWYHYQVNTARVGNIESAVG